MKIGRPSPAMMVALVALAVALGGTATAARTLIGGSDIASGAIKARHLAPGAVTGAKLAPGAVSLGKMSPSARPVTVASLPGPQGQAGPAGPAGAAGGFDPNKLTPVEGPDVYVPTGTVGSATADCPPGQRATGGGFFSSVSFPAASVPGASSWGVVVWNDSGIGVTVNAYVVCAAP